MKSPALFALLIMLVPAAAEAHTVIPFVSTPVTPPRGWWWLIAAFALASGVIDWHALKGLGVQTWRFILLQVKCVVLLFACLFIIGAPIHFFSGQLLPTPIPFGRAFYHTPTLFDLIPFLSWNALGLILFRVFKKRLYRNVGLAPGPMHTSLIRRAEMLYVGLLIPFLATNALTHGWLGPRIHQACERNLELIGEGLVGYANAHGGNLPQATITADVMPAVEPYLPDFARGAELYICPVEELCRRKPRTYIWNASFAGASLDENAKPPSTGPVMKCPADHGDVPAPKLNLADLFRLRQEASSKPAD